MMKCLTNMNIWFSKTHQRELNVALLVTMMLSACSSSTSEDTDLSGSDQFPSAVIDSGPESLIVTGLDSTNQDATSPWLVSSRLFRLNSKLDTSGDATVRLLNYRDDYPVSRHVEFYSKDLDTCDVTDPDAPPTPGSGENDGSSQLPLVSGGETVAINSPSGPWIILNKGVGESGVEYAVNNQLPGELLPAGATLSILGDEFPAVAAHPLFDPTAPERLLPNADIPVTADSAYSWIPSSRKTYMRITILAYDAENEFVDFLGGCDVRDDGSFTMPADVIDIVSATPYRLQVRYSRIYNRLDFVDGIAIRQRNTIAE